MPMPMCYIPTCSKCHQSYLTEPHVCPPAWEVWEHFEQTREDAKTIYADFVYLAVEQWAKRRDGQGDYEILGGFPAVACAAGVGSEKVYTMVVHGESVPRYSASSVDEELALIKDWNAKHPIGTRVKFLFRRLDMSESRIATTITEARLDEEGRAFVIVYGSIVVRPRDAQVIEDPANQKPETTR